jgi:hypothetical protein
MDSTPPLSSIGIHKSRPSHRLPTLSPLGWFLVSCGLVLAFQTFFVRQNGGDWAVLVRVGADKPHRAHVEEELGPIVCLDALGHDGQINYLIARDPFCRHDTHVMLGEFDNPPYRYRRILYPLLAGGFGLFGPRTVVLGLVLWLLLGAGLIAAAGADFCSRWHLSGTAMFWVLLNPGMYLSAQVLTADVLATGLALLAIVLWQRQQEITAALILSAAVLVRETSLLVSLSLVLPLLAQRRFRPAFFLAATSGLPWLAWSLWVRRAIPGGNGLENLSLPFVGIFESIPLWRVQGPASVVFGGLSLLLVAAALPIAWRTPNRFLCCSCLLWACLAVVMSRDVWGHPGNVLRTLMPLWVFLALGYGSCARQWSDVGVRVCSLLPRAWGMSRSQLQAD